MAQFATPTELGDRLGVALTASEQTRAGSLLTLASGLIQREARQEIALVTDDVYTTRGTRERAILLPERPVVSVASVTLDGTAISAGDWYIEGDGLVGSWGHPGQALVITYTHGYNPIPDAIKAVCLEAVVRAWINPGSVMRERYGSEAIDYVAQGVPSGLLLSKDERRAVREVVRRGSESANVL